LFGFLSNLNFQFIQPQSIKAQPYVIELRHLQLICFIQVLSLWRLVQPILPNYMVMNPNAISMMASTRRFFSAKLNVRFREAAMSALG